MKKKQFPIGFTDDQIEYLKKVSSESVASYVRKLVNEDMKKKK